MAGIRISSNNFNGKSVEITFNPFSGGTIDLGTQTIPYDYISSNYEGDYSMYIAEYNKTCPLRVGVPPSPTPSATSSPTPSITPTMTPTPTPSAPSIDPDAAAYLADVVASGGTTNPTIEAAVDTLFTDLKSNGLYSKMLAMYPYVGSTAASHSINALGNKTYDITWYGGMTHSVSGATGNGSNGYGDTHFSNGLFTQNSLSSGYYQINNTTETLADVSVMGVYDNNKPPIIQISSDQNNSNYRLAFGNIGSRTSASNSGNRNGNYIATRTTSNTSSAFLYRNNNLEITTTSDTYTSSGSLTSPVFVFNFNLNAGTPYGISYSSATLGFTFMGDGLSASEVSTLDGIINTFQTSLGRNTY